MEQKEFAMYEEIEKSLKFLTTSSVRNKILMSLREGMKDLSDLKEEMGLDASTIIHSVRDMEKEDLLVEREDGYHLTPIGKILSFKLFDMVKTLNSLNKNREFWLNHQIDGIPQSLLERIGELSDSRIIRSSPTDLIRVFSMYFEFLRKAKVMKGVSPIFHPRYPTLIEKLVDRGVDINLVLTSEALNKVIESLDKKHRQKVKDLLQEKKIELWVTDTDVKAAFTVTDTIFSLGLFSNDGTYDANVDLISHNKEAINWGRELYEYYRKEAKRIKPEDI